MKIKKDLEKRFEEFVEKNSHDGYSKGVVDYLIRWCDLMEKEPKLTKEKVDELSYKADTEGITGFMYDMARKYIYIFWEYGEQLKELLGTKMTSILVINN